MCFFLRFCFSLELGLSYFPGLGALKYGISFCLSHTYTRSGFFLRPWAAHLYPKYMRVPPPPFLHLIRVSAHIDKYHSLGTPPPLPLPPIHSEFNCPKEPKLWICSPPLKPLDYQEFAGRKWFELEVCSINLNPK